MQLKLTSLALLLSALLLSSTRIFSFILQLIWKRNRPPDWFIIYLQKSPNPPQQKTQEEILVWKGSCWMSPGARDVVPPQHRGLRHRPQGLQQAAFANSQPGWGWWRRSIAAILPLAFRSHLCFRCYLKYFLKHYTWSSHHKNSSRNHQHSWSELFYVFYVYICIFMYLLQLSRKCTCLTNSIFET